MANGSDPFLKNQALALTRGGVYFAAGVVVGSGYMNGETALTIVGAVFALLNTGWTSVANSNSSIAQAFAQIPSVKYVETTDPKVAEAVKSGDPATEVKLVKEKS